MGRKRDTTHTTPNSNQSLTSLLRPARMVSPVRLTYSTVDPVTMEVSLGDVEDQRHFHPQGPRRPQLRATGQVASLRRTYPSLTHQIGFSNPNNVIRCIRRKMRKEVLFAFNKQRKKGQSGGRYKRNYWSKIKC